MLDVEAFMFAVPWLLSPGLRRTPTRRAQSELVPAPTAKSRRKKNWFPESWLRREKPGLSLIRGFKSPR